MLSKELWDNIRLHVLAEGFPPWVTEVLALNFDQAMQLSSQNQPDQPTRPNLELREVTDSYLEFLAHQIRLEPRGPEWTEILKKRHEALSHYRGLKLLALSLAHGTKVFFLQLNPTTCTPVFWEVL